MSVSSKVRKSMASKLAKSTGETVATQPTVATPPMGDMAAMFAMFQQFQAMQAAQQPGATAKAKSATAKAENEATPNYSALSLEKPRKLTHGDIAILDEQELDGCEFDATVKVKLTRSPNGKTYLAKIVDVQGAFEATDTPNGPLFSLAVSGKEYNQPVVFINRNR